MRVRLFFAMLAFLTAGFSHAQTAAPLPGKIIGSDSHSAWLSASEQSKIASAGLWMWALIPEQRKREIRRVGMGQYRQAAIYLSDCITNIITDRQLNVGDGAKAIAVLCIYTEPLLFAIARPQRR